MTRFAADVLRVLPFRHQPGMCCGAKVARDIFVTGRAFLRADELRARDTRWSENRSAGGATGKQNYGQRNCSPSAPEQAFALTVDPSS